MDKKPLIGVCICAVVLLVLGSLSNVVGYQSVKSTVNDSPLFSVRTQKAINQESKGTFISDFLGKGIESNFQFPARENRMIMLQKVIDIVRKMDEKEFNRFQSIVVSRFYEDKTNKNIDVTNIVLALTQLRSNTKELNINQFDKEGNKKDGRTIHFTCPLPSIDYWFPGCIIVFVLEYCIFFIVGLIEVILYEYRKMHTIEVCE